MNLLLYLLIGSVFTALMTCVINKDGVDLFLSMDPIKDQDQKVKERSIFVAMILLTIFWPFGIVIFLVTSIIWRNK